MGQSLSESLFGGLLFEEGAFNRCTCISITYFCCLPKLISISVDTEITWAYIRWGKRLICGVLQGSAYLLGPAACLRIWRGQKIYIYIYINASVSRSKFWILAFLEALKTKFNDF